MNNLEYAYIYNIRKAQYFIREGHDVVKHGTSRKTGKPYMVFKKDEKLAKTTQKYKETMDFIEKVKK